ncbi:uncharacterized protein MKK02DRAFT_32096 [Dioszegia hungarica]|uniref:Uncharacterized protein n=1 Tax=Dioszegia hungarica TaxID=4972 RepID=A0AA38LXF4_9TREE|nr:uncharacterized protein MKK02DRAFT_32096 [Dioszegia hungarica]KAI9637201.1 hypothetical protein MKK02DRAFT_32096 [Dioszegia hungarica]
MSFAPLSDGIALDIVESRRENRTALRAELQPEISGSGTIGAFECPVVGQSNLDSRVLNGVTEGLARDNGLQEAQRTRCTLWYSQETGTWRAMCHRTLTRKRAANALSRPQNVLAVDSYRSGISGAGRNSSTVRHLNLTRSPYYPFSSDSIRTLISSLVGATVVSGLIRPALDSIRVVKMFALTVAVPGGRVWVAVAVSGTLDRTLPLAFEAVSLERGPEIIPHLVAYVYGADSGRGAGDSSRSMLSAGGEYQLVPRPAGRGVYCRSGSDGCAGCRGGRRKEYLVSGAA